MQEPDANAQWIINTLLGAVSTLTTVLMGFGAYFLNLYRKKVDSLEDGQLDFASQVKLVALEQQVATLATRQELITCMNQVRDDHQRMHKENLDSLREMREDFRNVNNRIDSIVRRQA